MCSMLPGDRLCVVKWREYGVYLLLWPCVLCCQVTDFAWSHDGNMALICYCDEVFYVARWQTLHGHMMGTWRWSATVTMCSMLPGDRLCMVTCREHGADLLLWPCVLCCQVTDLRGHMTGTWRWSATVTMCSMFPGDRLCLVTWRKHGVDLLLWRVCAGGVGGRPSLLVLHAQPGRHLHHMRRVVARRPEGT